MAGEGLVYIIAIASWTFFCLYAALYKASISEEETAISELEKGMKQLELKLNQSRKDAGGSVLTTLVELLIAPIQTLFTDQSWVS